MELGPVEILSLLRATLYLTVAAYAFKMKRYTIAGVMTLLTAIPLKTVFNIPAEVILVTSNLAGIGVAYYIYMALRKKAI